MEEVLPQAQEAIALPVNLTEFKLDWVHERVQLGHHLIQNHLHKGLELEL